LPYVIHQAKMNRGERDHKNAQRRRNHCALAVVRRTHKHRQGRLQYTAQLSAQCN